MGEIQSRGKRWTVREVGKLWAYGDHKRRLSQRKKDELDLIRLAEAYLRLRSVLPGELREQMRRFD